MSNKAAHEHELRTAIVTACREMNAIGINQGTSGGASGTSGSSGNGGSSFTAAGGMAGSVSSSKFRVSSLKFTV